VRVVVSHVILTWALIASLSASIVAISAFVNSHVPSICSAEACINSILESILSIEGSVRALGEPAYIALKVRFARSVVGGVVELTGDGILRLEINGRTFTAVVPKPKDVMFQHSRIYISEPFVWVVAVKFGGGVLISILNSRVLSTRF